MGRFKKQLYVILGLLAVAFGALGAALPILPTTPFLLVALFCFSRGSGRWDRWFRGIKLYKKYLQDYVQKRAMTLKHKATILLFADVMMAFPFIFVDRLFVRIIIILVLLAKYYYFIFKIDTIKPEKKEMDLLVEGDICKTD